MWHFLGLCFWFCLRDVSTYCHVSVHKLANVDFSHQNLGAITILTHPKSVTFWKGLERVNLDQFSVLGQVSTFSATKAYFLKQFNLSLAFGHITFTLIRGIRFIEPLANLKPESGLADCGLVQNFRSTGQWSLERSLVWTLESKKCCLYLFTLANKCYGFITPTEKYWTPRGQRELVEVCVSWTGYP